jgi:RNA polymerase sigma factor (sigma-70 family)
VGSTLVPPTVPHARELLAEFKSTGSQAAFEEIVRRYAGMVFGVCLRTTRNTHDAEDATQAVFLSLAAQCKSGDGVRFVGPWLQQVAKRVSLDIKRSKRRRETREQRHHSMNGNGNGHTEVEKSGAVDVDELKSVLSDELSQLPSKYRLPLILHYFGGMTRDEMAKELNCKPATLGVRIHRAREMLGRRLHELGAAPPGLVLSALLAGTIRESIKNKLVDRAVQAVAKYRTGHELGALISKQVMMYSRGAAVGAALAAKLKTAAAVLIVSLITAAAGGAVAKYAPTLRVKLPNLFQFNWMPKLWSPLRGPQASTAAPTQQPASTSSNHSTSSPKYVAAVARPVTVVHSKTPTSVASRSTTPAAPVKNAVGVSATARKAGAQPAPASAVVASRSAKPQAAAQTPTTSTAASSDAAIASPDAKASGDVKVATVDKADTITSDADEKSKALANASYLSVGGGGGGGGSFAVAGNINFDLEDVGKSGFGTVDHFSGINSFTQLRIGVDPGSRGVYNLHGGAALRVKRGAAGVSGILVGGKGDGELSVGDDDDAGYVSATGEKLPGFDDPSLVVRGDPEGWGQVEGWGTFNLGGTFENNGKVIANGYKHGRTLDFAGFRRLVNAIENPPNSGNAGWFARDGARLALPRIPVIAGTGTYTWGESESDDKIDLVNAARLTLQDVPKDGFLEICLLALDRGGIPPLPQGHHFIGIWQMGMFSLSEDEATGMYHSSPMDPAGIDLTVRYDDGLAHQLGLDENVLKLWKYQNGQWTRIFDDFARDPADHILTGHVDGGIEYFAVSAPEPGSATLILLGLGALGARRHRRRN